jgi:D-glycero-alpha-D-manno-heptose-7-phosphate kinase
MSGIGSSSSFTVGLLNALYALQGKLVTKRKLAFDAIHVEQNMIEENVGSQDQTAAAFGGFNKIEFGGKKDGVFVQAVTLNGEKLDYLQNCLLFYFTGFPRFASKIAEEQIRQTPNKFRELNSMCEMVDDALNILSGRLEDLNNFGTLLNKSWMIKKQLNKYITNREIDEIYEAALQAGALGGKLCGAGGGGFLLLFVPPENQTKVKERLKNFLLVPFRFENLGSHVVFYST